jgi:2-(3-amino-3-carboxypropyl)histidine synthase
MATGSRTVAIDPSTGNCTPFSPWELEAFLRKRWGAMLKVKEEMDRGGTIGIVIGTKPGQRRTKLADGLITMLSGKGTRSVKVTMGEMAPMKIRSLGLRAVVSTACPRIALDDMELYQGEGVTLLTPFEMRALVEGRGVENYRFDDEW